MFPNLLCKVSCDFCGHVTLWHVSGNLLTTFEDWELLINLVNSLNPPLSDRESANPIDTAVSPQINQHFPMSVSIKDDQPMSDSVRGDSGDQTATSDRLISDFSSINLPKSTSTADDNETRNECCAVGGEELTQVALLKLMLRSLPPLLVNELLSGCHGNSFGGKTQKELHSLLSKLTSIHTQQRYYFASQAICHLWGLLDKSHLSPLRFIRQWGRKWRGAHRSSINHHPIFQPCICCTTSVSKLLLVLRELVDQPSVPL